MSSDGNFFDLSAEDLAAAYKMEEEYDWVGADIFLIFHQRNVMHIMVRHLIALKNIDANESKLFDILPALKDEVLRAIG